MSRRDFPAVKAMLLRTALGKSFYPSAVEPNTPW